MAKKAGKITGIILGILVLAVCLIEITRGIRFSHEKRTNVPVGALSANWMKNIPDDTPLSLITIPGTHDSATQNIFPSYFLKCQSSSVKMQLANGFRYLDMRLALYPQKNGDTTLHYIHAFGDCKLDSRCFAARDLLVGHVLSDIYLFLGSHPSETVIFCVKAENSSDDLIEFARVLKKHIAKGEQFWYTENRIPTLGEVRGKIVLCSRFTDEENFGLTLNWTEQNNKEILSDPVEVQKCKAATLYVQDRYKYWPDEKFSAVENMMQRTSEEFAAPDTICLNFTSTSGGGTLSHPVEYAKKINPRLLEKEIPEHAGIIITDFATEEIAHHIWSANTSCR